MFNVSERYFVEQRMSGTSCSVHKRKRHVKVYIDKKDMTHEFRHIADEAREFNDDFILMGALVPLCEKKPMRQNDMLRNGMKVDPKESRLFCWDILSYAGNSLHDTRLYERKKMLSSLKLEKSENLREVPYILVSTPAEMRQALALTLKAPLSYGAILKDIDSIYPVKDKTTSKWIEYCDAHILDFEVVRSEKNLKGHAYSLALANKEVIASVESDMKLPEGSTLRVAVQEIWKHTDGRYTLHNLKVLRTGDTVCDVDKLDKLSLPAK